MFRIKIDYKYWPINMEVTEEISSLKKIFDYPFIQWEKNIKTAQHDAKFLHRF